MEITKKEILSLKERKPINEVCFKPIGIIRSPFKTLKGIPIQSSMSESEGTIEIFPEYQDGLRDLDGFSHIFCLYFFDMVKQPVPLQSKPFLVDEKKGVFATRTPFRPNPIGISILQILSQLDNIIHVRNVDMLDKTYILDIKPYVPEFDCRSIERIGWLQDNIRRKLS
ncbi:MAG: tRNA (N6-threonylcarbamoyladenosine(37)-N6)-methyltransferase TrmO [Candidatus Lokiarchaeota archaeon]|nr:tRNA (N6-threonylcarbamoyladenosine(37)-N6)-methyltransferase TrmO [Candidatus Lokiarchaeota archaeon]